MGLVVGRWLDGAAMAMLYRSGWQDRLDEKAETELEMALRITAMSADPRFQP